MKKKQTEKTKAVVTRLLEKAAEGCTFLDYGGSIERLVADVMTPGCEPDDRNGKALIRMISCLEQIGEVASVGDWKLVCEAFKQHVYSNTDESIAHYHEYTRPLGVKAESEVRHGR
jgi:hypothetical protein